MHPSGSSSSRPVDLKIFKRCLTEVFVQSSRTASRDRSLCNKIPPANFGLEILSKSGLEAVANDKDGGCSLVDPEVFTDIHLQLLGNGQFFETDFTNWIDGVRKLRCHTLPCVNVLKISSKNLNLRENFGKSLAVPGAAIGVQLVTSCKSHKPPGAVQFRNIHSAPRHAFAGLAMWSAKQHREQLRQFPTLYRDTLDFIHNISAVGH